jgi:hypothetical protein
LPPKEPEISPTANQTARIQYQHGSKCIHKDQETTVTASVQNGLLKCLTGQKTNKDTLHQKKGTFLVFYITCYLKFAMDSTM